MTDSTRALLTVLGVILVLVFGSPLVMGIFMMGGGMMMGPGMMGWGWAANPWWGIAGMVFGLAVLLGMVLLVIWAVRQLAPAGGTGSRALEILKERYARGELTREQYEQMRRDLEGGA